jgi:hypothetical protein
VVWRFQRVPVIIDYSARQWVAETLFNIFLVHTLYSRNAPKQENEVNIEDWDKYP